MADNALFSPLPPFRQSNALLDNWAAGSQPQMQSYSEPWYRALPNALTDRIYGPNANAQQAAGVRHMVGPENPLNLPAQFSEGVDTARTGYQLGNSMMAGLGAFQAATSLPLPGAKVAGQVAKQEAKGIRAYHGSPYDFDRFDLSKIGTGEGAQAYGHGLYFAENEGVAKSYKENLGTKDYLIDGKPLVPKTSDEYDALRTLWQFGPDLDKALTRAREQVAGGHPADVSNYTPAIRQLEKWKADGSYSANQSGRMYEVRINADPERFLDYDRPLSDHHPDIQKAVDDAHRKTFTGVMSDRMMRNSDGSLKGEFPHHTVAVGERGANALREAGIPGIKYLDQGSRTAGEGSRNYVVFDPATIEILRKYGLLGMIGGGAAATNGNALYGGTQ